MFNMVKRLIEMLGIEGERIRLEWVSSSEGGRFAEIIKDFTETIKRLGPSPLKQEQLKGE